MTCTCCLGRRGAFRFGAGLLAAAATSSRLAAQPVASPSALPARGEILLRGGQVLTMDPSRGDLATGDVHVRDGAIVAVGPSLQAPGAEVLDCTDRIVLPGFVDTHWHLWCTQLRMAIRADDPQQGYFPTTLRVGRFCTPEDAATGVRLGVAEGLLSGITTVHDWSHNTVTPAHADAEIAALQGMGIRARFSYGTPQGLAADRPMDLGDLARVQRQYGTSAMLGIGACLRTPGLPGARGAIPVGLFRTEMEAIQRLGLPMTIHCGPRGLVGLMAQNDLLGPDMLMVHPQGMTPEELAATGRARSPWSIAPVIEMSYSAVRSGIILYDELSRMDVPLGLSIDASAATNADYFNVMRALMWSDWQRNGAPQRLKPKRLVELATIEGAKLMGLGDTVGSLVPGKRADIVTVRKTDLNMAPVGDPYYALVFQGQPANVETVLVDGRVLVRQGRHTAVDAPRLVREAAASAQGILDRARAG
jgi:cytosine/adenosine deaminase-related metal-dependent hydrolase